VTLWSRCAVMLSRCRALILGRSLDRDFGNELRSHLAMLTEEYIRRGLPAGEARRRAALRLGGIAQLEERRRDTRSISVVETTLQDIRYALRGLRRHPAFTAVAVLTLAIGIGAGTSVFSVVGAVLLRPLPFRNPAELVRVFETNPLRHWTRNIAAPANYADWKARNQTFTDIAAYEQFNERDSGANDVFLTGFGEPQGLKALGVTGNLFSVLGVAPHMGRVFTSEETFEGKSRVAILSYGLWQSAFGGDPAIVGKAIALSGRAHDVVGVMPKSFVFPGRDVQLWIPVGYTPDLFSTSRRPHWLGVVARLRPGVSIERARQDMNGIARQLEQQYPDTNAQMGVRLEPLHDSLASEPRTALLMLSGAVALLFLIVCANIANLQLGRSASRSRELTVRRALGAGRARLLRQLLTESLVLSVIGGALGLMLAFLSQTVLGRFAASALPLFAEVRVDRAAMLFAVSLSLAAPIVFGVVPAVASSRKKNINLTERTEFGSRESRWWRNGLVAAEVALSIVLVVGAVLLVRSLSRLDAIDPGFDQQHAVAFTVTLPGVRYPGPAPRLRAIADIEKRLAAQPGVQAVGATSTLALRGFTWTGDATVEGRGAGDYERELRHSSVSSTYFTTMGVRLVGGRLFGDADSIDRPPVTIVNEALAARYFRNENPVGRRIKFGRPQDDSPWVTIVGVVRDARQDALEKGAEPEAYAPITQRVSNPLTFVVRSTMDRESVIASARRQVQAVDKDLALTQVVTLEEVVDASVAGQRFRTTLLAAFAGVALFLAALGIYGVLAYFVSQRSRELGIRLALGARPESLFRMVVGQGMRPVALGAAVGLVGAVALTTLLQSLLFGISAMDPTTYAVATATLVAIALAACAIPARRATRVDPMVALRDD
jgi:putative ABC transport system permease protein